MLRGYRVLDLCDEKGVMCGRILADLGAEVIKVERPGGDPSRNIGPFYRNTPHPENSLFWWAFNAGKRGITLNLESADGREVFKKLVSTSHFIVESFPPGYLDALGLGYEELARINPGVILASVTPFGQSGPYRDFKAPDIVGMALGGVMYITGDPDRPPVRMSFPLAYLLAGAEAAAASLIAHHYRARTGRGQHIDVAMMESVAWLTLNTHPWWELEKRVIRRTGQFRGGRGPGVLQRLIWPCRDGAVTFLLLGGATGRRQNPALLRWLEEEGLGAELKDFDWESLDMWKTPPEVFRRLEEVIGKLFERHTKEELFAEARKRGIMLSPVSTLKEITRSPHLKERGFWVKVYHPELGAELLYPGTFFHSSGYRPALRRAPRIGEHNEEVYRELGLTPADLSRLREMGVI